MTSLIYFFQLHLNACLQFQLYKTTGARGTELPPLPPFFFLTFCLHIYFQLSFLFLYYFISFSLF
jgi:hypothetical protein